MCRSWRAHPAWQPISTATGPPVRFDQAAWPDEQVRRQRSTCRAKGTPISGFRRDAQRRCLHKRLRSSSAEGSSFSASPRRRLRAAHHPQASGGEAPSRGSTTPRPWLTTIIFTAWTKTSDPSSSSSVPTFPTRAALHQRARYLNGQLARAASIRSARQRLLRCADPRRRSASRGFR